MVFLTVVGMRVEAQDPSFSQFFSSPLNINPALTGNINGEWRLISNMRYQWSGPAYPYVTGTVSFDSKILRNRLPENSTLALGMMMMYDKAMDGILKSSYASLNANYNIQVAEGYDGGAHHVGLGFGAIYGNRRIDFSRLVFGNQFNGTGFDTNLPTGESSLAQMKPYFSSSAGFLYSYNTNYSNLDIGVSAFHINKPKQTFLEDENQVLPIRYVAHTNFEHIISNSLVLNTNAVYQQQSSTSYFSIGAALGYYLSEDEDVILNGGLWYWSKNAIIPYVGFVYKNFQVGVTYDVTISKLNAGAKRPNTWEMALILRGDRKEKNRGIIPCPWK
jgi:type IX secretion system PorP/SprF family membrane protein